MQPTDENLTLLLCKMLYGGGRKFLTPVAQPSIPGSKQFMYEGADLVYIESHDGDFLNGGTFIKVSRAKRADKLVVLQRVWRMRLDRWVDEAALKQTQGHVTEETLKGFITRARMQGADRAVEAMQRNAAIPESDTRKRETISIFDVGELVEPVVARDSEGHMYEYGKLTYTESINNSLERFGGHEEVKLVRPGKSTSLLTTFVQGGRYRT